MRRFWKDRRGAVTVMVTLLLIPALLVSGTCVDIARSYSAKSAMQDGNQLGANAWMTQYNALLQDIYGLYGVLDNEDEFSGDGMLRDYIEASIFGPEDRGGLGFFELFYDSKLTSAQLTVTKNLGDAAVLRNQIEEYAKFRAPVAIATELLDKLQSFDKLKADAEVVLSKIKIDRKIEDIEKSYQKLYDQLKKIENSGDGYPAAESLAFREINEQLEKIEKKMKKLEQLQDDLDNVPDDTEEVSYEDERARLRSEIDKCGKELSELMDGLQALVETHCKTLSKFQDELKTLVKYAEKADKKKEELKKLLEDMDNKLSKGECSPEVASGMGESLEEYRKLLKHDIEPMAQEMTDIDDAHIESIKALLQSITFGSTATGSGNSRDITPEDFPKLSSDTKNLKKYLENCMDNGTFHVDRPKKGFVLFKDINRDSEEFYDQLEHMFSGSGDKGAGKKTKKIVRELLEDIRQRINSGFSTETAGASQYPGLLEGSTENRDMTELDTDDSWSDDDDRSLDAAENILSSGALDKFKNLPAKVADKALLLVYDTEMFSNYTSPNKAGEYDKTMSDIPMNTRVNYFFQSELEYLYHGDKNSAAQNLNAVTGLLFLVRLVFNYVASFMVQPVINIVNSVKAALVGIGPFAILVGEFVRFGLAMGESFLDVLKLRSGESVRILKNNDTWVLGGTSAVGDLMKSSKTAKNVLKDAADNAKKEQSKNTKSKPGEMTYRDYVRLFLLLVDGETLANRTAGLIALNITNYKERNNAEEREMDLLALRRFGTSITLTSTVELRFIFLSMGYAQKGIDGIVPPKTMTLTATEYRGY